MAEDGAFALRAPVDYRRLGNGLRVVVSADASAPIVAVAVYYEVGFRLEPRGRTGFAHLFEHLMFQGSEQLGKMELVRLVQQNGGMLNGSTRTDYTNYFEVLPKQALELALWLEADRMRGPRITRAELDNQRDVVKNEVRVNVLNRPYGGFPWIDMSERAFSNWHNAHNGYGEFGDLDAASLEDARRFFGEYYSPRNAVLAIVGAGCGSVGIEWMRAARGARAVAVERNPRRAGLIERNAERLGTPGLRIVRGAAPGALAGLDGPPDAVFAGGGLASEPDLLGACWEALPPGGRLVAHAVSLEGERRLHEAHAAFGGELTRIAVSRAAPLGRFRALRPAYPVTELAVRKR